MVKKWTAALLAAVLVLLCAGCKKNGAEVNPTGESTSNYGGVGIQVLLVETTEDETILHVQWRNDMDDSIMYGEGFSLQRLENDQWVDCPMKENTAFTSIGYLLEPGKTVTKPYAVEWAFGELADGHYRFVTSCSILPPGSDEFCELFAEFDIGESTNIKGELSNPPKLMINDLGEAITGGYEWSCAMGDGTWSHAIADSAHPLQMEKHLQILSPGNAWVDLNFEVWPDAYTVRCWPDSAFGDTEAESEAVMTWNHTIQLKTGGYVYEVTATWNDNGAGYYGTVTYVFYAAPAMVYDVMPIRGGVELYIAGEVLNLDPEYAKIMRTFLSELTFDPEAVCDCMPEYRLVLDGEVSYGIHLGEGYIRNEEGQTKLTAQQVKDLSVVIDWALEQTKAR